MSSTPFGGYSLVTPQAAATAHTGDIKFRAVFLWRRPAADDAGRRVKPVAPHVCLHQHNGGTVAVNRRNEFAEALHVGRYGVESQPAVGGRITDVKRVTVGRTQINGSHGFNSF